MNNLLAQDVGFDEEAPPSFNEVANGFNFTDGSISTSARVTGRDCLSILQVKPLS